MKAAASVSSVRQASRRKNGPPESPAFLRTRMQECRQTDGGSVLDFNDADYSLFKHKVPRPYSQALPIHAQSGARLGTRKRLLVTGPRDDERSRGKSIFKLHHYRQTGTNSAKRQQAK